MSAGPIDTLAAHAWPEWARQPGDPPPCATHDNPDLWYPLPGHDGTAAAAICRRCPLLDDCQQWAIDTDQRHGIWGATTPSQRREARQCRAGRCVHDLVSPDVREALGLRPIECPWRTT